MARPQPMARLLPLLAAHRWQWIGAGIGLGLLVLVGGGLGLRSIPGTASAPGGTAVVNSGATEANDGYLLPEYRSFTDRERAAPASTAPDVALDVASKLGVVLALILGAAWAVKRVNAGSAWSDGRQRQLQTLESLRLSPQATLHVVATGDKTLLLGATAHQVTLLADLSAGIGAASLAVGQGIAAQDQSFFQAWRRAGRKALGQRRTRRATAPEDSDHADQSPDLPAPHRHT